MSSDLVKNVTFVIKQLVKEEKMFTLLDVSREVQKVANSIISHSEIREYSKPIVEDVLLTVADWYSSETITLDTANGKVNAVLYFPEWEDPSDYVQAANAKSVPKPSQVQSGPVLKSVASSAPQNAPSCVSNTKWWSTAHVRSDGKVEIPKAALRAAGLEDEMVDVVIHPNSISLVLGDEKTSNYIRLTRQNLSAANLAGKALYVCAFSDKVVVCA